jgi:iron-sulfur cluster assembly protein
MAEAQQITKERENSITKNMTIGDVVQQYPHLAEILLENGVHCVGCGARYFETLEMGFKGHGMTDEQVDAIVKKLNQAIKNNPAQGETITITQKAAEKLKEILAKENKEGYALRVQVIKGGCAGNSYGLDFDKDQKEDDTLIEAYGIRLLADAKSLPLVRGAKIDYVDALQNAGFRISNPNAKRNCGCGQSFH